MADLVSRVEQIRAQAQRRRDGVEFRPDGSPASASRCSLAGDDAVLEFTEPTPMMRAGFRAIVDHDRNVLGLGEDHIEALKAEIAELVRTDFAAARAYCEQHGVACRKRLDEFEAWRTRLFAGINEEIIIDNERRAAEARQRRAA